MNKGLKRFLFVTTAAVGAICAYNQYVAQKSVKKNLLTKEGSSYFDWRFGKIFYTKHGTGKPLLLIHDTNPSSSSVEWNQARKKFEKNHTVYTIDLLGCGRSDKPALTYTNYLYVQLISAFVKEIIQEETDVIATNFSASFVIMANHIDSSLFRKIILVNPAPLSELSEIPDENSKWTKRLWSLPILGTFLYNLATTPAKINRDFHEKYYLKPQLISYKLEDCYYESSHLKRSQGKYLFASLRGKYVNNNISHALNNLDRTVHILQSHDLKFCSQIIDDYTQLNLKIETTILSNCKLLPQMEIPERFSSCVDAILRR